MYVARQLRHDARLTLSTYGHVIDELDDAPRLSAEEAIRAARHTSCVPGCVIGRRSGRERRGRSPYLLVSRHFLPWAVLGSNQRPPACKAGALAD